MFNPLTSPEVTRAVGQVLRRAATDEHEAAAERDDYQRSQLLSAYSITRHLAAELDRDDLAVWYRGRLLDDVRDAATTMPPGIDLAASAAAIDGAGDASALGDCTCELLTLLRRSETAEASALIDAVHGLLRELCDLEVDTLAARPAEG